MSSLISWLTGLLAGIPKEAVIFIVSMLPIIELRGGLIAASALGVPYFRAQKAYWGVRLFGKTAWEAGGKGQK